ncbi:FAD-binding oxidoreductase [Aeromonas hydrophila]|uniref:FAD-binding oxidoreductase n=1 Tax=Aeromonas hydrophila TaxID=644 RepID=UPI002B46253E|nr:FAD-binding oxidoreductase [Aeromonas hydrophila]
MKNLIKIKPSNIEFCAVENATVLESAIHAGFILEHSCKNGTCGLCESMLVQGEVVNKQGDLFSAGQKFLTCQCKSTCAELIVEAEYYPELASISRKTVPCKVALVEIYNEFLILKFRLPPTAGFNYLPGQYINLSYQGITRSYSIANANSKDGIELHIRLVPNGAMSGLLFTDIQPDTLMRIDGPIGTFFVREDNRPIIFLAGGTGFAPVKAMVESLINSNSEREIYIYWGMSNSQDFYSKTPQEWDDKYKKITFVPVVSGNDAEWNGRTGLVHQAVLKDLDNLSDYCVYACGSPQMIAAAKKDFTEIGLPEEQFFSDAFTVSK